MQMQDKLIMSKIKNRYFIYHYRHNPPDELAKELMFSVNANKYSKQFCERLVNGYNNAEKKDCALKCECCGRILHPTYHCSICDNDK